MTALTIRPARVDDLNALTAIYNHYVLHSFATFDEVPVTVDQRRSWFETYKAAGPYRLLVAEEDAKVLGCAGSGRYREHPAFRETVETSIYIDPSAVGRGLGRRLYAELFARLRGEPVHRALAAIALPNDRSVALHRAVGFSEVGRFDEYALKNGRRISSIWMQKAMQARD